MKMPIALVALFALAACGSQEPPQPEPVPDPTVAAAVIEPAMPAPSEEIFAAAYAAACPNDQAVNTSLCRSAGFGQDGFVCDYGLGDDEYRRNRADLVPEDGEWVLADQEEICAADSAA